MFLCLDTLSPKISIFILFDGRLQRSRVGTNNFANLLSFPEQKESRHGPDSEVTSSVGNLVNVKLVEFDIRVILGKGFDLWRNKPTGTAPGGITVENNQLLTLGGRIPFGLGLNFYHHLCCWG